MVKKEIKFKVPDVPFKPLFTAELIPTYSLNEFAKIVNSGKKLGEEKTVQEISESLKRKELSGYRIENQGYERFLVEENNGNAYYVSTLILKSQS